MDKESINKLIIETHGAVKKIEGKIESLQCARNEKWMEKIESKIDKVPSKAMTLGLSISMLLVAGLGLYKGFK